jgi:hypothetical protein
MIRPHEPPSSGPRGNRQLNAALHRIAITQIRITGSPGQLYYQLDAPEETLPWRRNGP